MVKKKIKLRFEVHKKTNNSSGTYAGTHARVCVEKHGVDNDANVQ